MSLAPLFSVAAGGALGSVARHYAVLLAAQFFGAAFPFGTFFVNVVGSFLIGFLMEAVALRWNAPLEARAFMVTGFLGGFTTFSAFSFDVFKLAETGAWPTAFLYILGSVVLSIMAVFVAVYIARGVFG